MEAIFHGFLTLLNLFLIVGCCVVFTNAVEHLGKIYNLNEGAVGSILAAVGTALPETIVPLVAILGAYLAHTDVNVGKEIGIGAILGAPFLLSTLAMFVTGVAVIIFWAAGKLERKMNENNVVMFRDLKFFFFSYTLAIAAGFIHIPVIKYACAAGLFIYYIVYVFKTLNCSHSQCGDNAETEELLFEKIFRKYNTLLVWLQVVVSIGALIYFAHLFVGQITYFADLFKINPLVLSLILAPIATELPEKFNSVLWVSQKKDTLALGNITGAMVFQSCIPTAIGILLTPWVFGMESLINILMVYCSTVILFVNLYRDRHFSAHILVTCGLFYLIYLVYVFWKLI